MFCTDLHPVCGVTGVSCAQTGSDSSGWLATDARDPSVPPGSFEAIIHHYTACKRLLGALRSVDRQLDSVRSYQASPLSNPALATARTAQLKKKRDSLQTLLRVNRREARALLQRLDRAVA